MGFVTHSERIGSTETPEAGGSGLWTSLLSVVLALGVFIFCIFVPRVADGWRQHESSRKRSPEPPFRKSLLAEEGISLLRSPRLITAWLLVASSTQSGPKSWPTLFFDGVWMRCVCWPSVLCRTYLQGLPPSSSGKTFPIDLAVGLQDSWLLQVLFS